MSHFGFKLRALWFQRRRFRGRSLPGRVLMLALMLAPMFMPGGVKTGENRRAAGKDFAPPSRIQSGRHRAARPLLAAPMLFFCCWVEVKTMSALKPAAAAVLLLHSAALAQPSGGASAEDSVLSDFPEAEFGEEEEIIVTANQREYGAVLGDATPELRLNVGDIASYGVTSIGELLEELGPQVDADTAPPVVLLNGRRLKNLRELRRYPSRAIMRVDVFPPDVAVRYGYPPTQKVLNIVLRPRFREHAAEVEVSTSDQFDYGSQSVEGSSLLINRETRTFLTAGYSRADSLLASKRLSNGRYGNRPYSLQGNIGPAEGRTEIDPALSALAGEAVSIAALPEGGGLTLADFARTANQRSLTDLNDYRTLMPSSRGIEAAGSVSGKLGEGINATASLNFEQTRRSSLVGLAGASLPISAANPYSPFTEDVTLYQYLGGGPLERVSKATNVEAVATANGTHGGWNWDFEAGLTHDRQRLRADRGVDGDVLLAEMETDPLALDLFDLAGKDLRRFATYDVSVETSRVLQASLLGSKIIGHTEAGDISASLKLETEHQRLKNDVTDGGQERSRTGQYLTSGGTASISVPLLRGGDLGSPIGGVTLSPYVGFDTSGKFGTRASWGAGVLWEPRSSVQLTLNYSDDAVYPSMSNLYGIEFQLPGELIYDPALGQMVSATEISGGNDALRPGRQEMLKANLSVRPVAGKSYTLTAGFTRSTLRGGVTRFPDPTAELEARFPERFLRGETGELLAFDSRPVNAHRSTSAILRFGFNASWRVTEEGITADTSRGGPPRGPRGGGGEPQSRGEAVGQPPASGGAPGGGPRVGAPGMGTPGMGAPGMGQRRTPPGRLRLGLHHTWTLEQELQLFRGGQTLDLLNGEGAGSRSGRSPHVVDLQLGYFRAGAGVSLKGSWNSAQTINRDLASGRFAKVESFYSLDLRLFKMFNPREHQGSFLSGLRLSLEVENLTDSAPKIVGSNGYVTNEDSLGRYIGRTFMVKARKSF